MRKTCEIWLHHVRVSEALSPSFNRPPRNLNARSANAESQRSGRAYSGVSRLLARFAHLMSCLNIIQRCSIHATKCNNDTTIFQPSDPRQYRAPIHWTWRCFPGEVRDGNLQLAHIRRQRAQLSTRRASCLFALFGRQFPDCCRFEQDTGPQRVSVTYSGKF